MFKEAEKPTKPEDQVPLIWWGTHARRRSSGSPKREPARSPTPTAWPWATGPARHPAAGPAPTRGPRPSSPGSKSRSDELPESDPARGRAQVHPSSHRGTGREGIPIYVDPVDSDGDSLDDKD